MTRASYALIGLARPRSSWFGNVSLWATSGAIPAEFAKCLSVAEIRQRLASLQPYSAVLLEAGLPGVDRDLIDLAARSGVPVIVVDGRPGAVDWHALGASAVVSPEMTPASLLTSLSAYARPLTREGVQPLLRQEEVAPWKGTFVAVCGPGGTGASTVAIALAQGISEESLDPELVLLADLARNGEQAMLHDAIDGAPGIEEVVDLYRSGDAPASELLPLTYIVVERQYRLLLGMRRAERWSSMPPRSVEAALHGLRRGFRTVVADITADFEGESDGGSLDVEERNTLARSSALQADAVVVVGVAGLKGTHSLAATVRRLLHLGVDASRIVPVVNRAPRRPTARAAAARALATLTRTTAAPMGIAGPLFLPERAVDDALQDGVRLPATLTRPLATAVTAVIERHAIRPEVPNPQPVAAGSLGFLDEAAGQ